jgi:hypothetical protein
MIIQSEDHKYSVDVGRPSFFEQAHRDEYKKMFELIETCSIPIVVNSAYHHIRDLLYSESGYGGGGFAFCFWFATKNDRKEFARLMKEIKFEISDWRNVMFYQDLNKKRHLRFDEKYLEYAKSFAEGTTLTIGPMMGPGLPTTLEGMMLLYSGKSTETNMVPVPGLYLADGDLKDMCLLKVHLEEQFLEFEPPNSETPVSS